MVRVGPIQHRADAIRRVHAAAFPTDLEASLVEQLIADGDAAISLAAEDDGEIVGHILFSRMEAQADGKSVDAFGLAPVAVLPERQGQGIGSELVEKGIAAARQAGADLIFVLGEPEYYGRFGFSAAAAAPFASPYAGPYFQALAINGMTLPASGSADYAPAFRELA